MHEVHKQKLGEILLSHRQITQPQLEQALRTQLVSRCRLGTVLVQLGALRVDILSRFLGLQHKVPFSNEANLTVFTPQVLSLVPRELCLRLAVIPFAFNDGVLHLGMRDPLSHIASEVSCMAGCKVKRYVMAELRIYYLLEKLYNCPRNPRFLRLPGESQIHGERRTCLTPTVSSPSAGSSPAPQEDEWSDNMEIVYLDEYNPSASPGELPADAAARGAKTSPVSGAKEEAALPGRDVEEEPIEASRMVDVVVARLKRITHPDEFAQLLINPIWKNTSLSLLFYIRGNWAIGCHAGGPDVDISHYDMQQIVFGLDTPSLLQHTVQRRGILRGMGEEDALYLKIASHLGKDGKGEICAAPILIRDQVVHLLCVQSTPGTLFEKQVVHELKELAEKASAALTRLAARVVSS
jgi:hypothetical protein